jgi:hypothetical protein
VGGSEQEMRSLRFSCPQGLSFTRRLQRIPVRPILVAGLIEVVRQTRRATGPFCFPLRFQSVADRVMQEAAPVVRNPLVDETSQLVVN